MTDTIPEMGEPRSGVRRTGISRTLWAVRGESEHGENRLGSRETTPLLVIYLSDDVVTSSVVTTVVDEEEWMVSPTDQDTEIVVTG